MYSTVIYLFNHHLLDCYCNYYFLTLITIADIVYQKVKIIPFLLLIINNIRKRQLSYPIISRAVSCLRAVAYQHRQIGNGDRQTWHKIHWKWKSTEAYLNQCIEENRQKYRGLYCVLKNGLWVTGTVPAIVFSCHLMHCSVHNWVQT